MNTGEASATVNGLNGSGIYDSCRQSKRPVLVEGIHDTFPKVVIDNSKACPNGRLTGTAKQ